MDCSLLRSSVHGSFQARRLEWVAISFLSGSSWPRDWTQVSCTVGRRFTIWATREIYDELRQCIRKQRHHFANKGPCSQSYGFSRSHVHMWELDHKEGWVPKNWCFQIVVLEKSPERPLDCKELKAVNPKGDQPWIFIGRTVAEVLILWPADVKNWFIGKDPDAGKDWRQKEKEIVEDKMVR